MTLLPERHGNRFALNQGIDVRFPEMVDKVMDLITDPEQMTTYSSAGADCRGGTGSGTDGK